MAARKSPATNNHLQEAMALLIRNQAAFVEQIARNDQERLTLQRTGDERQLRIEEWQRKTEEWMRKSDQRFARIETELHELPKNIVQTILDQLPRIKKEIGFKSP
jgi:5-formaminoimidazole-4-carboxamide-1-beta-D-ribofuranosyl 5'-monophosphate synthetase